MPALKTRIDRHAPTFAANQADHAALAETLRARQAWVVAGEREREIRRHLDRGKLMVRDRIDRVVDPGTAFLELSTLATFGQYGDQSPGGGIVTGIGMIHGISTMFIANDATVKGGTLFPETVGKHIRRSVPSSRSSTGRAGPISTAARSARRSMIPQS